MEQKIVANTTTQIYLNNHIIWRRSELTLVPVRAFWTYFPIKEASIVYDYMPDTDITFTKI